MKKCLRMLSGLALLPTSLPAAIRLNEVHFNPEGPDLNYEFIELKSTTNAVESLAGLSLVIVNNALSDEGDYENPGEILEVFDLSELSTGSNGLLLLGNGYTESPRGGPWSGVIDPTTAVADPAGLGNSDLKTNTGLSILLVRHYNALAGPPGTDIDKDIIAGAKAGSTGNGIIDWQQNPPPAGAVPPLWANGDVIDSIGTRDQIDAGDPVDATAVGTRIPYVPAAANIHATWPISSLGQRDPDSFARQLGSDTPHHAASFYGGKMPRTNPSSTDVLYRVGRTFGPGDMLGQVTPGRANLATSLPQTEFLINEVGLNPSGKLRSDNRFQYIEILNVDGQSRSLAGYWLLLIDSFDNSADPTDNSPGVGTIVEDWNLSNFATGPNGLLLLGEGYSPGHTPFQDAVNPLTVAGDPEARIGPPASSGWSLGDLKFKDGLTLLLVKGYTPPPDRDLDSSPQDGVLDSRPWTSLSDSIGFTQVGKTTIGRTYAGVDLRAVMEPTTEPHNLSRKSGHLSNSSATAWYGGIHPGGSSPMTLGFAGSAPAGPGAPFAWSWFGGFRGAGTPGQPNLSAEIAPGSPPIAASIRINEVMIDPTDDLPSGMDGPNEYLELISTNEGLAYLEGLYVLVVKLSGNSGEIQTGFPLDGYTTGTNGVVLIGDGYDNTNGPYVFSEGPLPANSAAFDPPVGFEGNDIPNDGCAILLVRGIKGPIILQSNGKPTGDLDPDNDGTLLPSADYTDELVDSIVVSSRSPGPGYAWISQSSFQPHHIARYPSDYSASTASAWYTGQIAQTPASNLPFPTTGYTGSYSGRFRGAASPGRLNHGATPGPVGQGSVVFNEIHLNPAGADHNFEFIELLSVNGAPRSLNGYSILAIDNFLFKTGAIRNVWSLDGMATGSNGLLLIGNQYTDPAKNPWTPVLRPQTSLGAPAGREGLDSSFSKGVLGVQTLNDNLALVLVRNFQGYIDFDLDDRSPIPPDPPVPPNSDGSYDSPGDGIFDFFPWEGGSAGMHDSILLRNYMATIPAPVNPAAPYPYDGWTYGLADLTGGFFPAPATLFYNLKTIARFQGETVPNQPAAWYGGDVTGGASGKSGTAEEYVTTPMNPARPPLPAGFRGRVTPGQPNLIRDAGADPDRDGLSNLMEQALNSDPQNAAPLSPLPMPIIVADAGQAYSGIRYSRIRGGDPTMPYAAEAYTYIIETSRDLLSWLPDSAGGQEALIPVGLPEAHPDGTTETVTLRLPSPISTPQGQQFLRLRVNRR